MSEPAAQAIHLETTDAVLQRFVGYHIKRTSNAILSDLARVLKPFDLRITTYSALALIIENPGLRQSQLAQVMDVERPNLVVLVDALEQRDLIVRDRVASDRRAYALRATPEGHTVYAAAHDAVVAQDRRLLHGLTDEQRQTLIDLAAVIRSNLEPPKP